LILKFGTILLHNKFEFRDGEIGRKFLIVLNTPDIQKNEPYVIVKTTSNGKHKDTRIGCSRNGLTFHIPKNQCFFNLDTWVILNEFYYFDPNKLLTDKINGACEIVGELDGNFKKMLINCIRESEDIEEFGLNLILKSYYRKT